MITINYDTQNAEMYVFIGFIRVYIIASGNNKNVVLLMVFDVSSNVVH